MWIDVLALACKSPGDHSSMFEIAALDLHVISLRMKRTRGFSIEETFENVERKKCHLTILLFSIYSLAGVFSLTSF